MAKTYEELLKCSYSVHTSNSLAENTFAKLEGIFHYEDISKMIALLRYQKKFYLQIKSVF